MLGALLSAKLIVAWVVGYVIQNEMCAPLQIFIVVVSDTVGNLLLVDIDGDEENAVI